MVNKKDSASSVSDSLLNKFFTGNSIVEENKKQPEKIEETKKEKTVKNTSSKKSSNSNSDFLTTSFVIRKKRNQGQGRKVRLNLVLTKEQSDKLRSICKETGYTMSGLIGEIINQIDFF